MAMRILYLDDEEDMEEFLPLLLKQRDIDVISTNSIPEALNKLREDLFDGVLLDIMMPPTDSMDEQKLDYGRTTGLEVAKRMKSIKPETPIVAFTALTDPEIRKKMYEVGIKKIINKPAELDEIVTALRQVTETGN